MDRQMRQHEIIATLIADVIRTHDAGTGRRAANQRTLRGELAPSHGPFVSRSWNWQAERRRRRWRRRRERFIALRLMKCNEWWSPAQSYDCQVQSDSPTTDCLSFHWLILSSNVYSCTMYYIFINKINDDHVSYEGDWMGQLAYIHISDKWLKSTLDFGCQNQFHDHHYLSFCLSFCLCGVIKVFIANSFCT